MNSSADRTIQRTKPFAKDLKNLPKEIVKQSWNVAQILSSDVFHQTVNVRKLHGYTNVWRAKVKRDYRLVYTFDAKNLYLLRIAHRKDIYRKPFQNHD